MTNPTSNSFNSKILVHAGVANAIQPTSTFNYSSSEFVNLDVANQLWKHLEKTTQDPAVALKAPQTTPVGSFGLVEYIFDHSPDILTLFNNYERYSSLLRSVAFCQVLSRQDELIFKQSVHWAAANLSHYGTEFLFAKLLYRIRNRFDPNLIPKKVIFEHGSSGRNQAYVDYFGSPVTFSGPTNEVIFPLSCGSIKNRCTDPALYSVLVNVADQLLEAQADQPQLWLKTVRTIAVHIETGRDTDIKTIADQLGLGIKSFQRKLKAEGLEFKVIKNEARRLMAKALLNANSSDIVGAAEKLGIEPETLIAKYKTWYGIDLKRC